VTLVRQMFVFLIDVLMLNYVQIFKTIDVNEYISKRDCNTHYILLYNKKN
jgi:hypothetical protein